MNFVRFQVIAVVIAIGAAMVYASGSEPQLESFCTKYQPTTKSCKRF